jgi:hypothetical protein
MEVPTMANPSTSQRPATRQGFRDPERPSVEESAPASPRRERNAAAGLNVLAGIWLIIAPFVLGYGGGDPYWNDIVFGALVAVIAAARFATGIRYAWLSWLNMLIGAWLFASAFWLDHTGRASWNDAILGVIVFLLGAAAATARAPSRTV